MGANFTIPNAMPIRPELQTAISFITSKLRVAGKYTEVEEKYQLLKAKKTSCD